MDTSVQEVLKTLDKQLEKQNIIIGQGRMLLKISRLAIVYELPADFLAELRAIDFTQDIPNA